MVVSTSDRSPYSGDVVDPQWGQVLARLVLSTCSGWVFDFCYLFVIYLVHTLSINTSTSYTDHPLLALPFFLCLFRNLVSIRELGLILGTLLC